MVKVKATTSCELKTLCDVLRSSILGPVLSSIYFADLPKLVLLFLQFWSSVHLITEKSGLKLINFDKIIVDNDVIEPVDNVRNLHLVVDLGLTFTEHVLPKIAFGLYT